MRVALVSAVFAPTRGGMCTVATAEANALAAGGVDVTVFTLATRHRREDLIADRACGAPVVRLHPLVRISISGFVPQLLWYLRGYDVVYAHLPAYGFLEVLLLWKLLTRRRLVVTVHMDPIGTGTLYRFGLSVQRVLLRAVIRIVSIVRVSNESFAAAPLLGTSRERGTLQVIPFGIDLKMFAPPAAAPRGHVYLFVGRLSRTHYFKGVELLITCFAAVCAIDADSELWIVGDGEERGHYEHVAQKLKISRRVRFLGAISDDELRSAYKSASVMTLPSIDTSETFGLVLLEAMACGVPVIASRVPGVDTLVGSDGAAGVLIEPGNPEELAAALVDASRHRAQWSARRAHARARAETFGDWTTIAARVAALL